MLFAMRSLAAEASVAEVVRGNTAFAVALYQRAGAGANNVFFSPYSISTALAMTYAGARGQTEQEMARALHFTLPQATLHPAFAALGRRMDAIGQEGQLVLGVANSLWCQKDYPLAASFLAITRDDYGAEARSVDFAANPEPVRLEINSWTAGKTRDKIKDLLHPGDLSTQTKLVLCDAVYFKGQWADRFNSNATQVLPFFTAPSQPVNTPLMTQTLKLRSRQFDDFALFALPYTSNALSMIILLPKAVDGLAGIERRVEASKLEEWLAAMDGAPEAKAVVFLPRFKLTRRIELAHDLAALGMPSAFGPRADFSGMSARRDLFIDNVVHQAFVDVNEEGTEAAAATAVVMKALAVMANPIPVFRADHPFLFLIRENQTGSILFLGRLADPTK